MHLGSKVHAILDAIQPIDLAGQPFYGVETTHWPPLIRQIRPNQEWTRRDGGM